MCNDSELNQQDTKYIIETNDKREMLLYLNASRMALALDELISWYKDLYNGKDYGYKILYRNKEYDLDYWMRNKNKIVDKKDLDKDGTLKNGLIKEIYTSSYIEKKLDESLYDIKDIINNYMGY